MIFKGGWVCKKCQGQNPKKVKECLHCRQSEEKHDPVAYAKAKMLDFTRSAQVPRIPLSMDKLQRLYPSCLCGHFESCAVCSPSYAR